MTETVSLPEALLVSRFGTAGPAALTAFLRIQDPKGTVMTDLTAPVAGAASVTISMNRGSGGIVLLAGPKTQVAQRLMRVTRRCPPSFVILVSWSITRSLPWMVMVGGCCDVLGLCWGGRSPLPELQSRPVCRPSPVRVCIAGWR